MATPDIICVELRDPPVRPGYLVNNGSTIPGTPHTFTTRNNPITGQLNQPGVIVGPNSEYFRYGDIGPTAVLNRAAVKVAANYGAIDGKTVIAVYFRSMIYTSGKQQSGTFVGSNKHFVYLKLSGNLSQGSHTITFPSDAGISPIPFTFNDKTTRATGIRYTQAGQQASDAGKLGYFGLWIPGAPNEGAIEIATAYSLTAFEIIDAAGTAVFSGTMSQRATPTSNETNQSGNGLQYLASTNIDPLQATSVIPSAATTQFGFAAPHGLVDGDRVFCRGLFNEGGRLIGTAKVVTVVDPVTITLPNSPATTWTYTPNTYLPGYDSLIYKAFQANRAATYVYSIDFSAWTSGAAGNYRIRIPGLGVSDPFKIGADAWLDVAKVLAAGEYNNRFGINADARFGYQRPPQCGSSSTTMPLSALPAAFSNEAGVISNPITTCLGGVSPYVTGGSLQINAWGSHHSAGDNDGFSQGQWFIAWMLVDAYQNVPAAGGNVNLNIPKSSQVRDPAVWPASTDALPDLIHQAIWWCDFYRQTQQTSPSAANGMVAGGLAPYGTSDTNASLGYDFEPSYITSQVNFLLAGDLGGNYGYAGAAAKLGMVLNDLGFTTQGAMFINSAILAFNWAEAIWNDTPNTGGPCDQYFIGYLDFLTKSGWSTSTYATRVAQSKTGGTIPANNNRIAAACALQRATGDIATWSPIADLISSASPSLQSAALYGGWDYINTPGANSTIKSALSSSLTSLTSNTLIYCESSTSTYNSIGNNNATIGIFGGNGCDFSTFALRLLYGHKLGGNSRFIAALQKCFGLVLGANQYGMSMLCGCGARNPGQPLQFDAYMGGTILSAVMGTSVYAWAGSAGGGNAASNWGSSSSSNIIENLQFGQLTLGQPGRLMEPWRYAVPMWDAIYENYYIVNNMEFAINQTTIPQLECAIYLNGYNK